MPNCSYCGHKLVENAKFCFECGSPVKEELSIEKERKIVYEGEVHKCPNCGELLGSFMSVCPACGCEIRGVDVAPKVRELIRKLEEIDMRQPPERKGKKGHSEDDEKYKEALDEFEEKQYRDKAVIVSNFAVPNTKEELFELTLLAASNINVKKNLNNVLVKAWIVKLNQAYEKAKLSMGNGSDYEAIKKIYDDKKREIKRKKIIVLAALGAAAIISIIAFGLLFGLFGSGRKTKFETLDIKSISMEIPNYWEEEDSENECLSYYAERGNNNFYNASELHIEFHEESDAKYEVSFEGLYADKDNMEKVIEKEYTDANVLSEEIFESDHGVKGILYQFSLNHNVGVFKQEPAKGYCFCFPSEEDNRWYYVTMIYTTSADSYSYEDDFMETIASIKEK